MYFPRSFPGNLDQDLNALFAASTALSTSSEEASAILAIFFCVDGLIVSKYFFFDGATNLPSINNSYCFFILI